jgi:hypothetical protein
MHGVPAQRCHPGSWSNCRHPVRLPRQLVGQPGELLRCTHMACGLWHHRYGSAAWGCMSQVGCKQPAERRCRATHSATLVCRPLAALAARSARATAPVSALTQPTPPLVAAPATRATTGAPACASSARTWPPPTPLARSPTQTAAARSTPSAPQTPRRPPAVSPARSTPTASLSPPWWVRAWTWWGRASPPAPATPTTGGAQPTTSASGGASELAG